MTNLKVNLFVKNRISAVLSRDSNSRCHTRYFLCKIYQGLGLESLKSTFNKKPILKDSLDPFLINVSSLINVQLLTSDHSLFKSFHVKYC